MTITMIRAETYVKKTPKGRKSKYCAHCHKAAYPTLGTAQSVAVRQNERSKGRVFQAYKGPVCGWYHLTTTSPNGEKLRRRR